MKKIKLIQSLSMTQWVALLSAYWRLWPMVLRIKFKQFCKDTTWITKNITFVENLTLNCSAGSLSQDKATRRAQYDPAIQPEIIKQLELAKQLHESVRLAARLHFLPAQCLPRSLVLAKLLKARNIEAHVYIGVSKKGKNFASHAWIEVCQQMITEPEAVGNDFTPLHS